MPGSIKKDGSTWYYILELGKDPKSGKRKQKKKRGFKTKKEAQAALVQAENEVLKGTFVETEILYKDFLDKWLEDKKTKVKESTLSTYTWLTNTYISPTLGMYELSNLKPWIIQDFYNELVNQGKLSRENVQKVHSLVHDSLKRAERWELIQRNPASLVDRPRASKKEMSFWTQEEVLTFLKEAKDDRLYGAFLLAITTGMRQAEILGLRWKDIDFNDGSLCIVQTLSHDGKRLITGAKTNASIRKVDLPEETLRALRIHYKLIHFEKCELEDGYQDHDLVVCTQLGTPVIPRNLMRSFYRITRNAGVPKIRFHDLRHTHASMLLKQGVNPKIVAERLGHANIRITLETYSHLMPSMQKETAQNFGKLLFG
ncbi:tyrosine-type recombinase/integrase [Paenibacillus piri]|uniref:Site-specific integrase n=1 Tax=Paenibacillus piri TaxID=2547395 RepID=A0A4R5KM46_9BACL|nr:site-specific integrase [Paenibacillus piri]TDF96596.1 site-specific integrase [Paenibacillus piri]